MLQRMATIKNRLFLFEKPNGNFITNEKVQKLSAWEKFFYEK